MSTILANWAKVILPLPAAAPVGQWVRTVRWVGLNPKIYKIVLKGKVALTTASVNVLKGSVSRDILTPFFHDLNPSMPLINRLKYFRIHIRFRRDIRSLS